MTDAISGGSAKLKVQSTGNAASGTTGSYTTIAEVMDLSSPDETLALAEVLTHDSTYMERVATHRDGGTLDFDVVWESTDASLNASTGLISHLRAEEAVEFRLFWSTGASRHLQFDAFVQNAPVDLPVDNIQTASISLALTGAVTESTST